MGGARLLRGSCCPLLAAGTHDCIAVRQRQLPEARRGGAPPAFCYLTHSLHAQVIILLASQPVLRARRILHPPWMFAAFLLPFNAPAGGSAAPLESECKSKKLRRVTCCLSWWGATGRRGSGGC